jgi:hypothetical protein
VKRDVLWFVQTLAGQNLEILLVDQRGGRMQEEEGGRRKEEGGRRKEDERGRGGRSGGKGWKEGRGEVRRQRRTHEENCANVCV